MGSLLQVLFSRIHQVLLKCPLSVTQVLQESLLNSMEFEETLYDSNKLYGMPRSSIEDRKASL